MSSEQHRKYMITIHHPQERGLDHQMIKDILASLNATYWCIADEVATTGTPHTHVFIFRKGAIRVDTIRRKFPGCHFDACQGTCAEARAYIRKEGKWAETEKAETSVPGTFEEGGTMPSEREEGGIRDADLIDAIEAGLSTAEIIRRSPKYVFRAADIDLLRQTLIADRYRTQDRVITVHYLYGPTSSGKIGTIYASHPAAEICRVTNYGSPSTGVRYDGYHEHPVLVYEGFLGQIPLADLLIYLDRHPLMLPARYSDRVACYTTVYIVSNVPLEEQYTVEQRINPGAWKDFISRIGHVVEYFPDGPRLDHKTGELIVPAPDKPAAS